MPQYNRAERTVWLSGTLSGCPAARSIIRDTAETRPSPPERAERLQARVSDSNHNSVLYSTPPVRNESVQRGLVRLPRLLMIARSASGMCLVRVCRSESTGPAWLASARRVQTRAVLGQPCSAL
jgi:hypothetical protein